MILKIMKFKFVLLVFLSIFAACSDSSLSIAQPKTNKKFEIDAKSFPPLPSAQKIEEEFV